MSKAPALGRTAATRDRAAGDCECTGMAQAAIDLKGIEAEGFVQSAGGPGGRLNVIIPVLYVAIQPLPP